MDRKSSEPMGTLEFQSDTMASYWPAKISDAALIVDPSLQYVLLLDHSPSLELVWTWATVPLSKQQLDSPEKHQVRGLRFDALLRTDEFLKEFPKFEGISGLDLWQLFQKPPDTLALKEVVGIPSSLREIVALKFLLPHDGELAQVCGATAEILNSSIHRLQSGHKP